MGVQLVTFLTEPLSRMTGSTEAGREGGHWAPHCWV